MTFDMEAPLFGWNETQKPYAKAIKRFQKNKVLKKLTSKYSLKGLCSQMKVMLRAYDFMYLDPVVFALDKLIIHDRKKHKIMKQIISNVRWNVEKNVKEILVIEW